jgi:hypothetical protein
MNGSVQAVMPPQSLAEIESLVTTMYQPGLPGPQLVEIQKRIHDWGNSDMGFDIGNAMLSSSNPIVQFMGAITINNKFNGQKCVNWFQLYIIHGLIGS